MNSQMRNVPLNINFGRVLHSLFGQRGRAWGLMIIGALLAFEVFNFSTTEFALSDVLGGLTFLGIKWSTILSIAFCGIDFAGIARLFTPEQGADEPAEVWYLFGAWVLAAAMNATLTWWGVSVAIATHTSQGSLILGGDTIQKIVPVFVAVMVWVIRILIIGTFSVAGERIFSQSDVRPQPRSMATPARPQPTSVPRPNTSYHPNNSAPARPALAPASQFQAPQPKQPAPSFRSQNAEATHARPEPTYHNLVSARSVKDPDEIN